MTDPKGDSRGIKVFSRESSKNKKDIYKQVKKSHRKWILIDPQCDTSKEALATRIMLAYCPSGREITHRCARTTVTHSQDGERNGDSATIAPAVTGNQYSTEFTLRTRDQCGSSRVNAWMHRTYGMPIAESIEGARTRMKAYTRAENAQREARSELDCSTGYAGSFDFPSFSFALVLSPFFRGLFAPLPRQWPYILGRLNSVPLLANVPSSRAGDAIMSVSDARRVRRWKRASGMRLSSLASPSESLLVIAAAQVHTTLSRANLP